MTDKEKKIIEKIDFIIYAFNADKVIIKRLGVDRLQSEAHHACLKDYIEELIEMIEEAK